MSKAKVPALYSGFKSYVRFLTEKIYYRKVYYLNTENVPEDGTPLLIVSDHQNSLNDALGILMSISDRVVHVIVRADVFALSPIADKFLRSIGLLPAFRLNWEGEAALEPSPMVTRRWHSKQQKWVISRKKSSSCRAATIIQSIPV